MTPRPRRVGILGYDDVQGLDVVGPLDVFATANDLHAGPVPYELLVLGLTARSFRAECGARFVPDAPIRRAPALDTVIIPGGCGVRCSAPLRARIAAWILTIAPRTRRVASVCTGLYALAETGLLDGRRATTHWRHAPDIAARYPAVDLDPDAIYIKDERFYTAAGITSGVDLSLALVEEDLGRQTAFAVARELVVYLKRSGGQLQYSLPLRVQTEAAGDLAQVVEWMLERLQRDLSVEMIAERMGQSPRHVTRRFVAAFGQTPARFVDGLRLDAARWQLASGDATVAKIGAAHGYRSADAFRRAFERRFGLAPTAYRLRFGASPEAALGRTRDPQSSISPPRSS